MQKLLSLVAIVVVSILVATPTTAQEVGGGLKENLDLPYDAVGDKEQEEDAPEIIEFYGQTFEGDGIFYTIDRSGSMRDSGELAVAKREVTRNISEFSTKVQFGVVFFARDIKKYPPSGQPAQAEAGKKQAAISWVQAMGGNSGSCCQQGIVQALDYANKSSAKRKTVIYVGDGGGTCPGSGSETDYHRVTLGIIKGRNYNRAQINAVGVLMNGRTTQREFLQKLVRMNSGTYTEITR